LLTRMVSISFPYLEGKELRSKETERVTSPTHDYIVDNFICFPETHEIEAYLDIQFSFQFLHSRIVCILLFIHKYCHILAQIFGLTTRTSIIIRRLENSWTMDIVYKRKISKITRTHYNKNIPFLQLI